MGESNTNKSKIESRNSVPADDEKNGSSVDFDPYDYGQEEGVSAWGAAILIIRACVGSTLVLMPNIIKSLGYVTGTVVLISTGFIYFHTIHSLVWTEYRLCKKLKVERLSYIELTDKTFERAPFPLNKCRFFVRSLMYAFYCMPTSCVGYLILTANEIQIIARYFDVRLKTTDIVSVQIFPIGLLCMSPKILKILVPFSSVTNVGTLLMAATIAVYSMLYRSESIAYRAFGDLSLVPECVAKLVKAFVCTGLILPIKNEMRAPKKMAKGAGALNAAAFTVTMFYYSFAAILYANYGDEIRENVLFNLPEKNYVTDGINLFYAISMYVLYVLSFFGRFDNVWSGALKKKFAGKKYELLGEYGVRIGINLIAYLLAVCVPNFALISALSGTVSIVLEMALPSILELLTELSADKRRNYFTIIKDALIISVCFVLFCMSAKVCVMQVIKLHSS